MIRGLVSINETNPIWFRAVCDKCGTVGKNIEQSVAKAKSVMLTFPRSDDRWKKVGESLLCGECAAAELKRIGAGV